MEHRHILISVRDFVFRWVNKEFLIFLFFLALSGIFWLMMTLNETYEKELDIPLQLSDVPGNVVMTTEMSDTVRATIRDKGFVLLSYSASHRLRPLSFSFRQYSNKTTGKGQIPITEIQKAVRQQLFSSTSLVSVKAESNSFMFNYGERKVVPITLMGNIRPGASYYIARVKLNPDKATVYSSRDMLDSLTAIATIPFNIDNVQDTVVQEVALQQTHGMKAVPQTVNVEIYPDVLTEESIEIPVTAINMPEGTVLRTFPKRIKVFFTTGASMVRTIMESTEDFVVTADYNEFGKNHSEKCHVTLQNKPKGVKQARLERSFVDYLVEQQ